MKIKNVYGREVSFNAAKYAIDWDRKVSKPQQKVKEIIAPYWKGNLVCEEMPIPSSRMRIDLINLTLGIVVEVSPISSHCFNEFFHKNRSKFLSSLKRDLAKAEWALQNGFRYVAIDTEDLKNDEVILNKILS